MRLASMKINARASHFLPQKLSCLALGKTLGLQLQRLPVGRVDGISSGVPATPPSSARLEDGTVWIFPAHFVNILEKMAMYGGQPLYSGPETLLNVPAQDLRRYAPGETIDCNLQSLASVCPRRFLNTPLLSV